MVFGQYGHLGESLMKKIKNKRKEKTKLKQFWVGVRLSKNILSCFFVFSFFADFWKMFSLKKKKNIFFFNLFLKLKRTFQMNPRLESKLCRCQAYCRLFAESNAFF